MSELQQPDPERIAAFLDGGLSAQEEAEVRLLLDQSPAWREVLAETVALTHELEEELGPIEEFRRATAQPAPPPVVAPRPPWAQLLAAGVAALALGAVLWFALTRGPRPSAQLVAFFAPETASALPEDYWSQAPWTNPVHRGSATPLAATSEPKYEVRIGALSVDLAAAVRSGDQQQARGVLYRLLHQMSANEALALFADYYRSALGDGQVEVAAAAAELDELLLEELDSVLFATGRWAEATRLATWTGDTDIFEQRWWRHGLERLREADEGGELAAATDQLAAEPMPDPVAVRGYVEAILQKLGDGETSLTATR